MRARPISETPQWLRRRSSQHRPLDHSENVRLPPELLLATAQCIQLPRDILRFSLASRKTHKLLLPALYASLECKTYYRCKERLTFLAARPELARHIKRLVIRPNHLMSSSYIWLDAEVEISEAVERLAPQLSALATFIWDGLEPPEESLWIALRTHCPRLRHIGSTVGGGAILEDSELFTFSDLEGFSLITNYQDRPFSMLVFHHPDAVQSFPEALWTMLLDRCANLKELTLGGERVSYYTPLFDVRPLTRGRWPKLHSLTLGHTLMQNSGIALLDWDSVSEMQSMKDFSSFISSHRHLRKLHIPYDARFPALDLTGSDVLITEFSGTHFYLGYILPYCHLTTLSLSSLSTLELWVDLSHRIKSYLSGLSPEKNAALQQTDHIKVLRPLVLACPRLLHLKIMCTTKRKFGFAMKDFWKAIEKGPRLQSLEVQKVWSIAEENMTRSASRIARHVPSLQQVTLLYAKQPWSGLVRIKVKQTGVYDLSVAGNGNVIRVVADENGEGLFRPFTRRYTRNLRLRTIIGHITGRCNPGAR
ncbi:hypothetical protein LshimejAT787_0108450 [Lyophyllum shimeji]|uniref:Uncharacterized protein n=1 Tax=Lyophyllum shimeji TaxID=47721 RepID=A0A9P3PEF4_LYOSH|nr:hypothetical protein LshimejAT787_0108450 [Lyophyllum shimeji]